MPLNEILPATNASNSGFVFFFPQITALSGGGYALNYGNTTSGDNAFSKVFNAQGQPVGGGPTTDSTVAGYSDIAGLSGGGYALIWENEASSDIRTAVFNAQGQQQSVTVNASGNAIAIEPKVTALSNGGYALAWQVPAGPSGFSDIITAVYDAAGQQVVAPINVTNSPDNDDNSFAIATLSNGAYAIAWNSATVATGNDILTAVYDANGQLIAGPVDVSSDPTHEEGLRQIAALSTGGYALTWGRNLVGGGGPAEVLTAVYNSQGQEVVAPVVVAAGANPKVAALTNGNYALFWQDGGVFTAVYDSQGHQVSAPVKVTNAPGQEFADQVTALSNGAYVVTWEGEVSNGLYDIFTAVYNAQGQQVVGPVDVSNTPNANDTLPEVTALAGGAYALVWLGDANPLYDAYTAVYQYVDSDSVSVVGSPDIAIDLSAIVNIGGDVIVTDNGNAVTIDLSNLASVGGNFVVSNNGAVLTITIPSLVSVGGAVSIGGNTAAGSVDLDNLTAAGSVDISDNTSATTIGLGSLSTVAGSVTLENNSAAGSVALGSLESVGGAVSIGGNTAAGSVDLDNLTAAGSVDISDNTSATTIGLGSLSTVAGSVTLENNSAAGSVALGSLESVGGAVSIGGNTAAGSVDLDNLTAAGSVDISDNTSATTIGLGSLSTIGGSVDLSGNTSVITIDLNALVQAGGIVISNNGVVTLNLSALVHVGGVVEVTNNHSLLTIDLPGLTEVGGNFTIASNTSATVVNAAALVTVSGNLDITGNTSATVIDASSLTTVNGNLDISGNTSATAIDASSLTTVDGNLDISGNTSATAIDASSLTTVNGNLDISGNTSATAIDASSLTTVDGNLDISGNTSATVIDASSLTTVDGNLDISGNTSATVIDASSLTTVNGNLDISGNTSATAIDASSLTTVDGNLDISGNTSATAIDASSLTTVNGNLDITGNTTATVIDASSLTTVDGNLDIGGNDSASTVNAASLVTVSGNVSIDLAPDAAVDASALGPGGGSVRVIGDDGHETMVILGSLAQMQGTLTITTADGVTLTSSAGLATITLTGTAGDNILIGSETAKNVINAGGGDDTATGGALDDVFTGGADNDLLNGKGGSDTAVYSGNRGDYDIVQNADGSLAVTDIRANAPDGTDTVSNFELFKFANGTFTLDEILPPPVITSNGGGDSATISIVENTAAVTAVTATDPNAAQMLDFAIIGGADAAKFQIDAATGELSFKAAPNFEVPTDEGTNNVYDVVVRVSNGFHADTQALAVTVTSANEAPVIAALSALVGENDPSFSQNLLFGASDPDLGNQLVVTGLDAAVTTAGGRTLAFGPDYTLDNGAVALTATGFAKFDSLAAMQSDQFVFHFGVSDGDLSTPNTLAVTMSGANDAPFLVNQTPNQAATVGALYSFTMPSNTFLDVDNGDHLTLAATKSDNTALPAWLSFDASSGTFTGTPGAADAGGFDIKLSASDTGQLAAFETIHFTVAGTGANHPPVITSDGGSDSASVIVTDNSKYVATVHANDPDPNAAINYSIVGGADGKLFSIDPTTGLLLFKAEPREGHTYQVGVAASDGSLQDTQTIKVQVANGLLASGNTGIADTFVFKSHFGLEIVNHFDATSPQHDVLELDHALFRHSGAGASPSATFDIVLNHSFQLGPDVVIVTDTLDVIDLHNTNLHSLTAHDFLLT